MRFMQTESVLQTKNRSEPAKNRFSVALVRSTRRAIAVTPVVRVRIRVPVTLRQSFIFKFSKSSYLDSHSSESIHIWTIGTLEGRLSFHIS